MPQLVLWKPLYYVSIAMFGLSLVLFPFNQKWSIVAILALVTLWSRVPGFVHFIFNKLALNDLFAFLVAANVGGLTGALFGAFGILGARVFGPYEWWPYSLRASIAVFAAGLATPLIVKFTGGVNVTSLYLFEGALYLVYYLQVVLFWREEIGLEVAILPAVVFFDFVMNAFIIKLFGTTISNMMTSGLSSGWPFIVFSAVILGFVYLSRNGKEIAQKLLPYWNKIKLNVTGKKETPKELPKEKFEEKHLMPLHIHEKLYKEGEKPRHEKKGFLSKLLRNFMG